MIRTFLLTLLIIGISVAAFSQDVTMRRTSDLMPQLYVISGDAFLEELSNGELTLRLSEDFSTPRGPDVRILLGNSLSNTGTVEIVNLSTISHFRGARTFSVPAGININDFDNILFYCVRFRQFWASGSFGDVVDPNGGGSFECDESEVTLSNGGSEVSICPSDNQSDELQFANSLSAQTSNYAYLITDENDILSAVIDENAFDFEGSTNETQRVHGIHFDGDLDAVIGSPRLETSASGCFTHSSDNGFVTIRKTTNCGSNFECQDNLTATTNWQTSVEVCPNDGDADWVPIRNNLFIPAGDHYAFLITDESQTVQQVVVDTIFNFEGSSLETQRVYGIHFDGELNPVIGANRMQTTATGCFTHSGDNLFLTVNKTCDGPFECVETLTATTNWVTNVDVCANDQEPDNVRLVNNLFVPAGENYVFMFTDESEILQEVVFDTLYNFEGTGDGIIRVYGLSYDGELFPQIGEHRRNTTASECFIHSGDNLFLTINRTTTACSTTSTNDDFLQSQIEVYPNPNNGEVFIDYGELQNIKRVEIYKNTGELLQVTEAESRLVIEQSGIVLMRFITEDQAITKRILVLK